MLSPLENLSELNVAAREGEDPSAEDAAQKALFAEVIRLAVFDCCAFTSPEEAEGHRNTHPEAVSAIVFIFAPEELGGRLETYAKACGLDASRVRKALIDQAQGVSPWSLAFGTYRYDRVLEDDDLEAATDRQIEAEIRRRAQGELRRQALVQRLRWLNEELDDDGWSRLVHAGLNFEDLTRTRQAEKYQEYTAKKDAGWFRSRQQKYLNKKAAAALAKLSTAAA